VCHVNVKLENGVAGVVDARIRERDRSSNKTVHMKRTVHKKRSVHKKKDRS